MSRRHAARSLQTLSSSQVTRQTFDDDEEEEEEDNRDP